MNKKNSKPFKQDSDKTPKSNNNIERRYIWAKILVGISIYYAFAFCGITFHNDIGFNYTYYNNNRLAVWLSLMLVILSVSLLFHVRCKKLLYKQLLKETIFCESSKQNDCINEINKTRGGFNNKTSDLLLLIIAAPIIFLPIIGHYQFVEQELPTKDSINSFIGLVSFMYGLLVALIAPLNEIEDCISKNRIRYKFKFSDKTGGIKNVIKYLNTSLVLSINIAIFLIMLIFSYYLNPDLTMGKSFSKFILFLADETFVNNETVVNIFYIISACIFMFPLFGYCLSKIPSTIISYRKIIKDLKEEKNELLQKIIKKNDLEALIMYDKINEMRIISPIDKVTMPIKLLISPTLMTYLRGKILSTSDIDTFIHNFFP